MKIAITDASIFIDLYELGCLDWLVKLEFEIHTTTLVLNELSQDQLMQLIRINQWLPAKECELRQKAWKE